LAPASLSKELWIYTDGACSGNPGPGGWAYLSAHGEKVWAAAGYDAKTTNNRMEMLAAIEALKAVRTQKLQSTPILLFTDSSYVLKGIQEWVFGWMKRDWKKADNTDVLNRDLWEELLAATQGLKIKWVLVPGHSDIPGNEFVDEWSVEASLNLKAREGSWTLAEFPERSAFETMPEARVSKKSSSSSSPSAKSSAPKGKAFYVSLVKGALVRHATWAECEARVRGISGARFKKVASEAELAEVLRTWNHKI
jgi:ribonuclease HI